MFYLCPITVAIRLKGCQLSQTSWLLRQQQTLIKKEITGHCAIRNLLVRRKQDRATRRVAVPGSLR